MRCYIPTNSDPEFCCVPQRLIPNIASGAYGNNWEPREGDQDEHHSELGCMVSLQPSITPSLFYSHEKSGNSTEITCDKLRQAKFADLINNRSIIIILIYATIFTSHKNLPYRSSS